MSVEKIPPVGCNANKKGGAQFRESYLTLNMAALDQFLMHVDRSIKECDGELLSELVALKDSHVFNGDAESACQVILDSPYDEMLAAHIRCVHSLTNGHFDEAFACQTLVVQSFCKGFQAQKEENWGLPVLQQVVLDLRRIALKAESVAKERVGVVKGKKEGEILERAAEQIMSCFRVCVSDSRTSLDNTKRWGTLGIVNQLFKIYFKLNKLPLCKPLIRAIDSSDIRDEFSISHRVTYKYFVGRKAMFDSEYRAASEALQFAFSHCHKSCHHNKKLILTYLIPLKMMFGQMPRKELLDEYNLLPFYDVALTVSTGNLYMFAKALEEHEGFFIKAGIYLILEKLRTVALRNLFKKVWILLGRIHQLELKAFEDSLKLNKEDEIDADEVECIMANLIDKGKIKGYISHSHQKLVVSKQNPFPSLSSF
ncbi:PREDICTED: PCI domain-containing protein 2-like [Amphimedon queenslandica]|uniref:CSN12-like protein n=2 Tax=Amphimedon queenslandica TaxID=400682 RepID=A0A1X7TCD7_AMPQE|nr:PREDICTED: PCI domain-containing protein 2-like [Amphimedon queenslandica]|eukprot:XP_019860303.1 PREDICTED: PCI domain-containing protein 2-like [Amphimedon queenslandica]